jgi:hypothetical protein
VLHTGTEANRQEFSVILNNGLRLGCEQYVAISRCGSRLSHIHAPLFLKDSRAALELCSYK